MFFPNGSTWVPSQESLGSFVGTIGFLDGGPWVPSRRFFLAWGPRVASWAWGSLGSFVGSFVDSFLGIHRCWFASCCTSWRSFLGSLVGVLWFLRDDALWEPFAGFFCFCFVLIITRGFLRRGSFVGLSSWILLVIYVSLDRRKSDCSGLPTAGLSHHILCLFVLALHFFDLFFYAEQGR